MNAFRWCNNGENGGIKWLACDRLCDVKEVGGLGFKNLVDFNVAMLAKQAWRLINNTNPLVSQIMKAKYYPKTDFLNASLGANPSYVWRSILESQTVVRQGCRRRIGDGRAKRVWQVQWLPSMEDGCVTSVMYSELAEATVDSLMTIDGQTWDDEILSELCNDRDKELIYQIPIPLRSKPDSWFWLPDTKGSFTVRSCYRLIRGESVSQERDVWARLWSLKLPGKISNFIWRVVRDVLPTTEMLIKKHVDISPQCAWCHNHVEDVAHVLFQCCFAREVWESTCLQNLVFNGEEETGMETFRRVFQTATKEKCALVGLFCWGIWVRRNKWVWEKISMSVFGVKHMAIGLLSNWNRAKTHDAQNQNRPAVQVKTWCKPDTGWVKINIDAACFPGSEFVAVGCVARDAGGIFLRARSNVIRGARSPREAEAMSMREALSWVKDWRVNNCVFESDSKLLIDALNKPEGSSLFHTIVEDCSELAKHFENVLFQFVPRSANNVAHEIARAAYSSTGLKEWFVTAPDLIVCNLLMDDY